MPPWTPVMIVVTTALFIEKLPLEFALSNSIPQKKSLYLFLEITWDCTRERLLIRADRDDPLSRDCFLKIALEIFIFPHERLLSTDHSWNISFGTKHIIEFFVNALLSRDNYQNNLKIDCFLNITAINVLLEFLTRVDEDFSLQINIDFSSEIALKQLLLKYFFWRKQLSSITWCRNCSLERDNS